MLPKCLRFLSPTSGHSDGFHRAVQALLEKKPSWREVAACFHVQGCKLPTPFGAFMRQAAKPGAASSGAEPKSGGDLLPISVEMVRKLPCVGPEAKPLLSALLHGLNFHYCCGWTKTICWPPPEKVTNRQLVAVAALRKSVGLPSEEESVGGLKEAEDILTSKTFDYDGLEVQRVSTLSAPLIIEAWPAVGEAAVANIEEFLEGDALDAVRCPQRFFKKGNDQPPRSKKAKVLASQEDWNTVVSAAFERGMMAPVDESRIPRDAQGHLIVNEEAEDERRG